MEEVGFGAEIRPDPQHRGEKLASLQGVLESGQWYLAGTGEEIWNHVMESLAGVGSLCLRKYRHTVLSK